MAGEQFAQVVPVETGDYFDVFARGAGPSRGRRQKSALGANKIAPFVVNRAGVCEADGISSFEHPFKDLFCVLVGHLLPLTTRTSRP